MENSNERSRQPEINADYIDKLLSISTAPAEEPVTPVAEETAPAPASEAPADTAPVQKAFPTPLLILAGVALLGVGFLLGWLAKPVPEDSGNVTLSTSPSGTTDAFQTEPGIAPDYVSMSTQQLVTIAVQIEGLSDFGSVVSATGLQEQAYEALKKDNPVLAELEQRPDAV